MSLVIVCYNNRLFSTLFTALVYEGDKIPQGELNYEKNSNISFCSSLFNGINQFRFQ